MWSASTTCVALAAVATLSGCASTMTASSHVRRGFELSQYRTYDWGPADELPAGDPRLDITGLVDDQARLEAEIDRIVARILTPLSRR